ncbi:MAG: hypothetical protein D3906_18500 [Candidatus Electrothrix sp. AUS1_2]|nr:hypothetical protein [Candidatus Electrothrix sp. AUS1_2]
MLGERTAENAQAFDAVFLTDAVDLLLILFKGDHIIGLAGERRSSAGEAAASPLPQYDKQLLYVAKSFKEKSGGTGDAQLFFQQNLKTGLLEMMICRKNFPYPHISCNKNTYAVNKSPVFIRHLLKVLKTPFDQGIIQSNMHSHFSEALTASIIFTAVGFRLTALKALPNSSRTASVVTRFCCDCLRANYKIKPTCSA